VFAELPVDGAEHPLDLRLGSRRQLHLIPMIGTVVCG
jgi:hypothetical protein